MRELGRVMAGVDGGMKSGRRCLLKETPEE